MARISAYELNAFDPSTKGRRLLAVAAKSRKEAVAMLNGRSYGPSYTGRINIVKDPEHPAAQAGEGVTMLLSEGQWVPLPPADLDFDGSDEAVARLTTVLEPLGFGAIPPSVDHAAAPARCWWRPGDGIVVSLSHRRSGEVIVSAAGGGLYIPARWSRDVDVPGLVRRAEEHIAEMAEPRD